MKMDSYSVKINFMGLYMNTLRYCQSVFGDTNTKPVLDTLLNWTNTLTRQHSTFDTLNENKLQ